MVIEFHMHILIFRCQQVHSLIQRRKTSYSWRWRGKTVQGRSQDVRNKKTVQGTRKLRKTRVYLWTYVWQFWYPDREFPQISLYSLKHQVTWWSPGCQGLERFVHFQSHLWWLWISISCKRWRTAILLEIPCSCWIGSFSPSQPWKLRYLNNKEKVRMEITTNIQKLCTPFKKPCPRKRGRGLYQKAWLFIWKNCLPSVWKSSGKLK